MSKPSQLTRILGLTLAATTAALAPSAKAESVLGEKTPLPDSAGWTRTITSGDAGTEVVVAYTNTAAAGYTFTIPEGVTAIDYLVVGGGGGGGGKGNNGGGGGAGGVLTNIAPCAVESGDVLKVIVGAGGAINTKQNNYTTKPTLTAAYGGNSSIENLDEQLFIAVARGGGAGGCGDSAGGDGGSGGGAGGGGCGKQSDDVRGLGIAGQGNDGGGHRGMYGGSGGGGAGAAGAYSTLGHGNASPNGYGGEGIVCELTGEAVGYAAGGGGGGAGATTVATGGSAGGVKIGGDGGGARYDYDSSTKKYGSVYNGTAGVDGTGSGGGGCGYCQYPPYSIGGKGGSGIVVIRYTSVVKASFQYDASRLASVAVNGTLVDSDTKVAYIASNSVATVTVTPNNVYEYTTAPKGWTLEGGSISCTYTSSETAAAMSITIPDPEKKAVETVPVTFTEAVHATKVATVDGVEIGPEVVKGSTVVVVATPETHYEYAEVPAGWVAASGAITYTFTASEATAITIPEPTLIMVPVTVTGLDNTSSVITTNEVEIASGTLVPEGTEFVVTVTPLTIYEYTAAPTGWTKNSDGTIIYSATTEKGMAAIQVPSENFAKQQVTLGFTSGGVSYVASNVWDMANITAVKHGDKVNVDAQIEVRATAFPTYTLTNDLGSAWTKDGETIVGTFAAGAIAGAITIPTANWTPTDGELVENGGFEYFDYGVGYTAMNGSFPASFLGGWVGRLGNNATSISLENTFGLWKEGDVLVLAEKAMWCQGAAHSGTYAGGVVGGTQYLNRLPTYIQVPFTTPATAGTAASYRLSYWRKHVKSTSTHNLVVTIRDAEGGQVGDTIDTCTPTKDWVQNIAEITGLTRSTQYYLRFDAGSGTDHDFAVDDISLKQLPPKGLIILLK